VETAPVAVDEPAGGVCDELTQRCDTVLEHSILLNGSTGNPGLGGPLGER
jgi:hypothetical protein